MHHWPAGSRFASRRAVLCGLLGALGGAASLLGSCTAPAPQLPFGLRSAPQPLTLVVGGAYIHVTGNPQDRNSLVTVADGALQKWAGTAQEGLHGRATIGVRVADLAHEALWLDATLAGGTITSEQPLYLASHAMLWRLRGGGIGADLGALVARDHSLAAGRLHPNALECFRWRGQLAGLPVALWPALMATDARLPAPPAGWTWDDAARLPVGSGAWPVQLLPDAPPRFLAYSPFVADQTAAAFHRRWSALTADQAATLATVLRLRLRPVWGVTSARLIRNPFLPGFLPDATQGVRASRETEDDYWDVPKRVESLLQSLSMVVALGILPPAAAAPNAAHEIQGLLELWATPA